MSVESALLAAFAVRLGPVELQSHEATTWSSATFSGERHVFRIETEKLPDLAAFARDIGEADIPIPRGFVADIAVADETRDEPRCLTVEVLTIDA